jgi:CDP-glucose 4,6-dehydratase
MNLGNVFITGGTGLLGSELVSQILSSQQAISVVCLVRDELPLSPFFLKRLNRRVTVVRGDVRDVGLLNRVMGDYSINTIFHLAAQTLVQTAVADPFETMDTNVRGTYALLEAARQHSKPVRRTIVASSDKAYGNLNGAKYDESYPLEGRYPYDVSKSCTDLITQSYGHAYHMDVRISRCGNIFGPGDLNESRIFPSAILSLLKKERPIVRSNGKLMRDYIYVSDAAAAYLLLATHTGTPKGNPAYNFSYGSPVSVLDVISTIAKVMGVEASPLIQNGAKDEIPVQSLDSSKARAELGWSPKVGFEAGIKETVEWYRNVYLRKKGLDLAKAAKLAA